MRAGSLLAADWLKSNSEHPPLLLWQPVKNGQQHLVQFLRLKAVNEMLAASGNGGVAKLREELAAGQALEIAGYELSPGMAAGLESACLLYTSDAADDRRGV